MSQDALLRNLLEHMTLEQFVSWLRRHMGASYVRALAMRLAEYAGDERPTRPYVIRRRGSAGPGSVTERGGITLTETTGQKPSLADLFRECTQALERSGYTPSPNNPLYYIGPVFTVQLHVPVQTFTLRGPMSDLSGLLATAQTVQAEPWFTLEEHESALRWVWESTGPIPGFSAEMPDALIFALRIVLQESRR